MIHVVIVTNFKCAATFVVSLCFVSTSTFTSYTLTMTKRCAYNYKSHKFCSKTSQCKCV